MKPAEFRPPPCWRVAAALAGGLALWAGVMPARADTLVLRSGERLIGRTMTEDSVHVRFDSQALGALEIPRERIDRIERDAPPAAVAPPVAYFPWSGLRPEEDTFDWIRLTSGEWLKGKVKSMYDEVLEFDSEKMDTHEFKWKDIGMVRSPHDNSVRFERAGTAAGELLVTEDEVKVSSASGMLTVPRADLLSIAPAGDKERTKWTGKVMLGFNLRAGNTEETSYNAHVALQRRTPVSRLSLDYLGNFNRTNGVTSEENQRVTGQFDYFLSRRLYVRFPDAEYYRDPLQNMDRRTTLGGAVGYEMFRTRRFEWDISAGPAYQRTRFVSVEPGQSETEASFAGVLSTRMDLELTQRIDWSLDYRGQRTGKDASGGTTHHANSTLEFEIHKRLKLDLSFIWDHVDSPKTESGGTTPTADDYRLITSLGIDF
jgi:putative salt-induced outer membrane protein YdiY